VTLAVFDGQSAIYCFKKALFLVHAVTVRFGTMSPSPFPVPNTSQIPVFADNVLPSLLIYLGVMDVSSSRELLHLFADARSPEKVNNLLDYAPAVQPDASKQPPYEGPITTSDQAYALRAGAIDACEVMVEVANGLEDPPWIKDVRLPDLDMWLWSVAKDRSDYRRLERFVLRDTVFF